MTLRLRQSIIKANNRQALAKQKRAAKLAHIEQKSAAKLARMEKKALAKQALSEQKALAKRNAFAELAQRAAELYSSGLVVKQVAAELNCSYSKAISLLRSVGTQFRAYRCGSIVYDPAKMEQVKTLYQEGNTPQSIGMHVGCCDSTVRRIINRLAPELTKRFKLRRASIADEKIAAITSLDNKGKTIEVIAKVNGCCAETVKRYMSSAGVLHLFETDWDSRAKEIAGEIHSGKTIQDIVTERHKPLNTIRSLVGRARALGLLPPIERKAKQAKQALSFFEMPEGTTEEKIVKLYTRFYWSTAKIATALVIPLAKVLHEVDKHRTSLASL